MPFSFLPSYDIGQPLKERICSGRSKFSSVRADSILEGLCNPEGSHRSCLPLKNGRKLWQGLAN